jgi:hypothetical protein
LIASTIRRVAATGALFALLVALPACLRAELEFGDASWDLGIPPIRIASQWMLLAEWTGEEEPFRKALEWQRRHLERQRTLEAWLIRQLTRSRSSRSGG